MRGGFTSLLKEPAGNPSTDERSDQRHSEAPLGASIPEGSFGRSVLCSLASMTGGGGNPPHPSRSECQYGAVDPVDTRELWNANAAALTDLSRAEFDVYRDLVNTPAFLALLPPVDGLRCLDLDAAKATTPGCSGTEAPKS
jgi:hypothetical protein